MMPNSSKKIIYLVSGPLGVGKSTTSKKLAGLIPHSVLIEGDFFLHMFAGEPHPSWEDRVRLSWINNLAVTRNFILDGLNVVIDFVVEEELDWFREQLSDLEVEIRYVVLRADENTIKERLTKRGDPDSLARSLFLLYKFENSPDHQPYLYDTTNKQPDEVAQYVLQHAKKVGADPGSRSGAKMHANRPEAFYLKEPGARVHLFLPERGGFSFFEGFGVYIGT